MSPIFRALGHRNYRLFFYGQSVSLVGAWINRVAAGWLVYRLTRSAFLLGVVSFSSQIPALFLLPLTGVLADRLNRHHVLFATQFLLMVQALIFAYLAMTHQILIWHIILLSLFQGVINSFDIPFRQSFLVEMVRKKEDLPNAIALNSTMFNSARLIGPSIAGILIGMFGEGICFLIDGISYLAVIASLLVMKIKPREIQNPNMHILDGVKEGFGYAFGFPPIRAILSLVALVSLMGLSYVVLLPVFAKDILYGGPDTLGFLTAASGIGALTGAFYLAARKNVRGLGRHIVIMSALGGTGLILFAFSHSLFLSFFLMVICGFGFMVQMAACNTVLQTIADDDKRGRLMSLYSMAFLGMAPFGSLLAGTLAAKFSPAFAMILGGTACLCASFWFLTKLKFLSELIRPIYVRKGIIPEVAAGIQQATDLGELPKD